MLRVSEFELLFNFKLNFKLNLTLNLTLVLLAEPFITCTDNASGTRASSQLEYLW